MFLYIGVYLIMVVWDLILNTPPKGQPEGPGYVKPSFSIYTKFPYSTNTFDIKR